MIPNSLVLLGLAILGGSIAGIVALVMVLKRRDEIRNLQERNSTLETRVARLESRVKRTAVARDAIQESGDSAEPLVQRFPFEPVAETRAQQGPSAPSTEPGKPPGPSRRPIPDVRHRDQQWWAGLEERAGKRWMTWAGALVLFLSVAFFVKYAFDNQWLGPTGRVVLGIMAGIAMLVAGDRCLRMGMWPFGQGLIGGALAILYVSLFAAFSLYRLLPQTAAVGGLVMVTAAGVALAVLHDAIPLSILAVLGGFITPLLVSTGKDPRDALFCYVTLLDLGVLGVAFFKRWRTLDVLAFVGTWALFTGW
jgi:uncharacterized membrane protein